MRELTIKVYWGSLGDHLLHSHLPRLAKERFGYEKVFISNKSNYYNPNVRHFVWELNPYVDGFNDEDHEHPEFTKLPDDMNLLDAVAAFYQILPEDTRYHEPEAYYVPNELPELREAVIFEPNHHNPSGIPTEKETEEYFVRNGIVRTHDMKSLYGNPYCSGRPKLEANDLFALSDIIFSCKQFYCYMSGVATLAAAIKKPCTVLYVDGIASRFRHSKLHNYVKVI